MKHCLAILATLLIVNVSLLQSGLANQQPEHVVSLEDLRSDLATHSAQREANIGEIQKLLRQEVFRDRLGELFDLERIAGSVPSLDDATLDRLAEQSRQVNDELRGGVGTIVWIIIAAAMIAGVVIAIAAGDDTPST